MCACVRVRACMFIVHTYVRLYCMAACEYAYTACDSYTPAHTYSQPPSLVCLQCAVCIQSPYFCSLTAGEAKRGALCHLPHSHQCSDTTGREVSPCGYHIVAEWLLRIHERQYHIHMYVNSEL